MQGSRMAEQGSRIADRRAGAWLNLARAWPIAGLVQRESSGGVA
ncbi:MAG TPA: hypothetical protein VFZ66_13680 [Herpetosiphonaceae bacterium]